MASLHIVVKLHWGKISVCSLTIQFSTSCTWALSTTTTTMEMAPYKIFGLPNPLDASQALHPLASRHHSALSITSCRSFSPLLVSVTQLYQLWFRNVTENLSQIGWSHKKLLWLHNWKSRGRTGIRVGSSFLSLGHSWFSFLPLVGFFLRLSGRDGLGLTVT